MTTPSTEMTRKARKRHQRAVKINHPEHGEVLYLRTVDEMGTTRLLRRMRDGRILRCQKTISRALYADYRAKGGFFSAGAFATLNWIP